VISVPLDFTAVDLYAAEGGPSSPWSASRNGALGDEAKPGIFETCCARRGPENRRAALVFQNLVRPVEPVTSRGRGRPENARCAQDRPSGAPRWLRRGIKSK